MSVAIINRVREQLQEKHRKMLHNARSKAGREVANRFTKKYKAKSFKISKITYADYSGEVLVHFVGYVNFRRKLSKEMAAAVKASEAAIYKQFRSLLDELDAIEIAVSLKDFDAFVAPFVAKAPVLQVAA